MTARTNLLLVAALALSTAVGATPAAVAAPEPTAWQQMLAQQPLIHAADVLQAEVLRGADAGFAGIVLETDHVALWWKGTVPAAISSHSERTAPQ